MKPIEVAQRDGVAGHCRFRPIVARYGGLAAASVALMALVAFDHNPYALTPSPAAVIRADPPSPPLPGATGNPDQQPQRECTQWDPQNNTTQDRPCDGSS